jgi:dihydrofolate reductase
MKINLIAAISLNGKIAQSRNQSSLEWTSKEDTAFFIEKTKESGTVIMGQRTFDTIGKPLKGRRLIVLTLDASMKEKNVPPDGNGTRLEFVEEAPVDLIRRLESEGVTSVVIGGGSFVYSSFLREQLVTDVFLTIEPILFGEGISLAESFGDVKLKLVESKMLGEQTVLLHYSVSS